MHDRLLNYIVSKMSINMSGSSKRWCQRQENDQYVRNAHRDGYESRAAYKLLEIQKKHPILQLGTRVIDLGAAPGSWTQVAADIVGAQNVIALDMLEMNVPSGVITIQGDFTEQSILQQLLLVVGSRPVDVILSDMAPNLSGQWSVDIPKSIYLVELAIELCGIVLRPGGDFLFKIFQGSGVDELLKFLRQCFKKVLIIKPKASRPSSREVYVLGRGFIR